MLEGSVVGSWKRRGKYLIATLFRENPSREKNSKPLLMHGWWGVHLRMTGYFEWHTSTKPPCSHTRVRFWNKEGEELRFVDIRSFGQMWWVPSDNKPENIIHGLRKLGPEPFSDCFNASYLNTKLQKTKRSIKASLLDQSVVAGAGNIYADETLFVSGIRPQTPSHMLKEDDLKRLCKSLIEVLSLSIGAGGTTFSDFRDLEGLNGNYGGQAWVYRRAGKPCRRCGTAIKKERLSGRSTHWCPKCQQ